MSPSRLRSGNVWLFWLRIGAVAVVFVLALGAFSAGAATRGIPEIASLSLAAHLYYAAGLFVFGGLDMGVPVGGSLGARTALWIAFFLAPAVTTSAVAEAFLHIIRPGWFTRQALRGHIVIVGAGQVGSLYLEGIRSVHPNRPVLLVDREANLATVAEAKRLNRVHFLQGDARSAQTLKEAALPRAQALVVVTDSDLVNLETAWSVHSRHPNMPIAMHVSDLTLLRPVERSLGNGRSPAGFNTHQMGAMHLYRHHLAEQFQSTGYRDVVVLSGFGRFAQTILELLMREAPDELARVVVVDLEASVLVRQFEADVSSMPAETLVIDGDMTDPATWTRVSEGTADQEGDPIYLLCAGDEVDNLRAAIQLRHASANSRVFARCSRRSAFSVALAQQESFELIAFEEVLRAALREHYQALVGH